jgi:hypothetical protein
VVWSQLRKGFAAACRSKEVKLVVDLHLLRSSWVLEDQVLLEAAWPGRPVRVIDLTAPLALSQEGFLLAAAAAKASKEQAKQPRR